MEDGGGVDVLSSSGNEYVASVGQRCLKGPKKKSNMAVVVAILMFYFTFIVLFMAVPASMGFSFGIRNLYLAALYKVFEVSVFILSLVNTLLKEPLQRLLASRL